MMAKETGGPLLAVKNLSVMLSTTRGMVRAVDGISFTLERGRTLGLVGESGCGKTMTAYSLMNLLPHTARVPTESAIRFQGKNLLALPAYKLRQLLGKEISIIFQDPMTSLNPVVKIGPQITEVLIHHLNMDKKNAKGRALTLLEKVGVPMAKQRLSHYPHQLSGGLRQRVAIAMALACEPCLLIADEPTTALDTTVQAGILDLIQELQDERQMAMILISHDLQVVAGRTHQTSVMYAGRIVEQAATTELYGNFQMPYTRALMNAVPRLTDPPHTRLETIGGYPPDPVTISPGCPFAPRCTRVRRRCRLHQPPLTEINSPGHRVACWYPWN